MSVREKLIAAFAIAAIIAPNATRADDAVATPNVVTFDEIDHVYANGNVPPPGAFETSLRGVAHTGERPHKRGFLDGALHGLTVAGTQLDNATSIVGSSGQLGQTLHIASGAAALAPVASAMGLAGRGQLDTLVQSYVLPRVSPSGAQLLSGYLAAQQEVAARYPHASSNVAPAPTPSAVATQADDAYARGSLRTYTIASTGRVRIDDPDERLAIVFAPDIGKTYAIDDGNRTVHVTPYDASLAGPAPVAPRPASSSGKAGLRSSVEPLPATTLGDTNASGYRTHVVMNVTASGGACTKATVTSDRVEYFAPIRVASTAANSSPFAPSDVRDACAPAGRVVATGPHIPADELLLYQANTIERTTSAGSQRYTLLIERGNLRTETTAPSGTFEIPEGYRQI
jgi:hypothetical protein